MVSCRFPTFKAAFFAIFLSLVASASAKSFQWEEVQINGRRYITGSSIKGFYKFDEMSTSGNVVRFIHRDTRGNVLLTMTARVGSQTLMMNSIKFILSYPVTRKSGQVLISRLDLCKLIDPVLRPKNLGKGPVFDTVVIDPGHGGHDSGAYCALGKESVFALDTANHLKRELVKRGYKVVMTRTTNRYITLGDRVKFANRYKNAIFISLHYNSGQSQASGIETFALSPQGSSSTYTGRRSSDYLNFEGNDNDGENIALSTAIHAGAINNLGAKDRGIKRARWNVLTGLKIPGTLYEGGFLSNASEARKISSSKHRQKIARSLAEGIANYKKALLNRRR